MEKFEIPQNNKDHENKEIEEVLEGWFPLTALIPKLGVGAGTIFSLANKYRQANPEYFKKFKVNGRVFEHYSPDLVKVIIDEIKKRNTEIPKALQNWETNRSLADKLGIAKVTVSNYAEKYRTDHPEYFREFRNKINRVNEYYSPELIKIIESEINKHTESPEGWKTRRSLAIELGVDSSTLINTIEKYRVNHPEYFRHFKNKQKKTLEHYSPELVKLILEQVGQQKRPPEGWRTNRSIAVELKTYEQKIRDIAKEYKDTHLEYFEQLKDAMGRLTEHYSPELIEIIKNEIGEKNKETPEAPENWKTKEDLAQETGLSLEDINKAAAKLKKEFPNKFGRFKDKE